MSLTQYSSTLICYWGYPSPTEDVAYEWPLFLSLEIAPPEPPCAETIMPVGCHCQITFVHFGRISKAWFSCQLDALPCDYSECTLLLIGYHQFEFASLHMSVFHRPQSGCQISMPPWQIIIKRYHFDRCILLIATPKWPLPPQLSLFH